MTEHYGQVKSVVFSHDGKLLLSAGSEKTIRLYWTAGEKGFSK
jgi:WD40 repeat protein